MHTCKYTTCGQTLTQAYSSPTEQLGAATVCSLMTITDAASDPVATYRRVAFRPTLARVYCHEKDPLILCMLPSLVA